MTSCCSTECGLEIKPVPEIPEVPEIKKEDEVEIEAEEEDQENQEDQEEEEEEESDITEEDYEELARENKALKKQAALFPFLLGQTKTRAVVSTAQTISQGLLVAATVFNLSIGLLSLALY